MKGRRPATARGRGCAAAAHITATRDGLGRCGKKTRRRNYKSRDRAPRDRRNRTRRVPALAMPPTRLASVGPVQRGEELRTNLRHCSMATAIWLLGFFLVCRAVIADGRQLPCSRASTTGKRYPRSIFLQRPDAASIVSFGDAFWLLRLRATHRKPTWHADVSMGCG